ncbi:hypothetical protein B1812_13385 [Methylocystis bryophila]|uniref:Uncharacterized protein n=1 Tax=Methylocystis bryophila TaxID=655015 RepID=A0A1W6MWE2_9HYPH|nr:hypothetical protein B1812_13385 [Methylocystis bryophila]
MLEPHRGDSSQPAARANRPRLAPKNAKRLRRKEHARAEAIIATLAFCRADARLLPPFQYIV